MSQKSQLHYVTIFLLLCLSSFCNCQTEVSDETGTPTTTQDILVTTEGDENNFIEPDKKVLESLTTEEWLKGVLQTHNTLRERHGSPPLALDSTLIENSKDWANQIVNWTDTSGSLHWRHSSFSLGYGENIAWRFVFDDSGIPYLVDLSPTWPVTVWYKEIMDYNYNTTEWQSSLPNLHFTQVVWAGTTHLGCGRALSRSTRTMIAVCRYTPQGNIDHNFESNVRGPADGSDSHVTNFEKLGIIDVDSF